MITLTYADHIAHTERQVTLLRSLLTSDTDLTATVPTCPDWTLEELVRHVGGALRWAALLVSERATGNIPDEQVPLLDGPAERGDAAALDTWFGESGRLLAEALRAAAPDTPVWSWYQDHTAGFWARRMCNELAVHRADAALAAGRPYEVAPEVAADTIEEWLEIVRFAQQDPDDKDAAELRRGGLTLHLHATDAPAGLDAEWLIELADGGLAWRREHTKADVALRGPLAEVMMAFHRRQAPDAGGLDVLGDRRLLDFWLERTKWG
ncbi:maleylpyruvate isomerase family mycothiol-dependent enzyme [Streptomyces abyssomicinicus]|uniref:maleylpyruvate isomerase family mycothiol-dependent enzyme n=1 Tax=Streptomyces abyssomicinicus TaxID=574929 RepID=UPI0012503432|nr:maleylpyruvate isomerase family mycothiol-dependent enzyme [Streptomyces abyssomicinicus]